jgi:hypothetical protein
MRWVGGSLLRVDMRALSVAGKWGRHGAPEAAAAGGRPAADDKAGRGTVLYDVRGDRTRHALPWRWRRARDRGVCQAGTERVLLRAIIFVSRGHN